MVTVTCNVCNKECKNLRSFSMHLHHNPICDVNHYDNIVNNVPDAEIFDNNINIFEDNDYIIDTNESNDELDNDDLDPNFDNSLIQMKVDFIKSVGGCNFTNQSMFNAQLDLIHLLDATQTPIYLYDKTMYWI